MKRKLTFSPHGPFDEEEQTIIRQVVRRVEAANKPHAKSLLELVEKNIHQLERLGEVLDAYPSVFAEQAVGSTRRTLVSLVTSLTHSTAANIEMFLPARALVSRTLVMGEVNFYRLLRVLCDEAMRDEDAAAMEPHVNDQLCLALYTRLAEAVLISIASDDGVAARIRDRAALGLVHIWDDSTYRVRKFFPILEATWQARRKVPVTLGTLLGAAEMFRLVEAGCDERFVAYLARENHTEDEAQAFREFLFGATTEKLQRLEAHMLESGKIALSADELPAGACADAHTATGDPALAMYEFFLSRHLQASARRLAGLPGPKRTAEEYVMLHFLERVPDDDRLSIPPDD
jgi:hypothetical protein